MFNKIITFCFSLANKLYIFFFLSTFIYRIITGTRGAAKKNKQTTNIDLKS